jgi:intracellular multiplication protein IcmD
MYIMRSIALLLISVLALDGCSAGAPPGGAFVPALPSFQVTGSPKTVDAFTITAVGADDGDAVFPLLEAPSIPTNQGTLGLTMWGTKNANGDVTSVTQSEVSGLGTGSSTVHVFFDSASRPVLFVDDTSGYSIAVTNETSPQPTITLCDPTGTADAYTTASSVNGAIQIGPVQSGGSCATSALASVARTLATASPSGSEVATQIGSLSSLAKLITAGSYVAGFGFALGAIMKFKAHKDNPTQVPVGTPIALIFIAAALIFIPAILSSSGATIFNTGTLSPIDGSLPSYDQST